ncbi:hypothetical protein THH46_20400 [Pseudomonas sp. NA13]
MASSLEPAHQIEACPAVQLLIERVGARQEGFKPDGRDWPTLAQICQRLDGLPLALELAAAQVDVLGWRGPGTTGLRFITLEPRAAYRGGPTPKPGGGAGLEFRAFEH